MLVEHRNWYPAPVYVRAPQYQYGNWRRYCGLYNACARPVYFVRDDWYRDVYAPRYHQEHGHGNGYANGQPYAYQRYGDDHRDDRNYDRRDHDRDDRNSGGNYDRRDNDRDYDHRDNDRHEDRGRPHN